MPVDRQPTGHGDEDPLVMASMSGGGIEVVGELAQLTTCLHHLATAWLR
jgi:hypothetical protein